ncbi:hypothetical protein POTOM_024526 [Populus tomentosa]|uniref:Uncharacterized protein n=1 Tax=Populus tomentosa TaxID=118781 RepID=A0A8X7ZFJ6_POPTO|nr:hypothetical protein POTOM_024526 [Populus tomentosa]
MVITKNAMGYKLSKSLNSGQKPGAGHSHGCGSSIIELLKPECLKVKEFQSKRQVHQEQKKEHLKGGELGAVKHGSKRVHPCRGRESFSKDRLLVLDHVADKEDYPTVSSVSLLSRTQSGKLQKRVSFKLPEEADIILIYSPQDSSESPQDCSM